MAAGAVTTAVPEPVEELGPVAGRVGGTGVDGGTGGGGGELPDAGTCVAAGQPCFESGLPCCGGGQCVNFVCTASTFCKDVGGSCTTSADCCNNRCENGVCAVEACRQVDAGCSAGTQCCTGLCNGATCEPLSAAGGPSYKVLGESCNADPDGGTANGGCCSSLCRNGVCAKAYYCQPNGDICHWNIECCGNVCSVNDGGVGRCLKITGSGGGGCTQEGNPCTDGAGCCSRTCFDPGSGARVCLPAGGCRLTGTSCDNDDACCGGGVNPNGTVRCSNGRCDNGQACNGVGNICSRAYLPDGGIRMINAPTNCCNGGPGNGLDVCKLDSSGIPRCFGGYSSQCPTGYTGRCRAASRPTSPASCRASAATGASVCPLMAATAARRRPVRGSATRARWTPNAARAPSASRARAGRAPR